MSLRVMRKQYIVDNMQYKILLIMVIYVLLGVLLAGIIMFFPSFMSLSADGTEQVEAAKEILTLHKRLWPAIIVVTIIICGHSIFLFHRIFGPLYRFKKTMKDIIQGDVSCNIKLRKNDFLKEEEDVINEMITSLRKRLESLKGDNKQLNKALQDLFSDLEDPNVSTETVRRKMEAIRLLSEKLKKHLEVFKTDVD
jgi:methyl-accepting chemotaxis protein